MRSLLIIFTAVLSLFSYAEIEFQLVTGSRFKGNLIKANKKLVVIDTAIGELKLKPSMLSPECLRALREQRSTEVSDKKPFVNIKVNYREKMLERDKDVGRHGRKREIKRKAGVITVYFNDLARGEKISGYIEYKFKAEATAIKRGKIIDFDTGIKRFEFEPNQLEPKVEIESTPVTHFSAKHTGSRIGERGLKLKGYSIKVYLNGHLVYEGEK